MPTMTVKDLRDALALLGAGHDHKPVKAWLPGSRIALSGTFILSGDDVLIEGNVEPGSALDDVTRRPGQVEPSAFAKRIAK